MRLAAVDEQLKRRAVSMIEVSALCLFLFVFALYFFTRSPALRDIALYQLERTTPL